MSLIVKLLTVKIEGFNAQFSTPLYVPSGQKKRRIPGHIHINFRTRVDVKWGTFPEKKQRRYRSDANFAKNSPIQLV
jgi:hypothetical protein